MWTVHWQGSDIDLDPLGMDMALFEQIEQKAGISGLPELVTAMGQMKPVAWKALFWAAEKRAGLDPGTFGDYAGPSYRLILSQKEQLDAFGDEFAALVGFDGAADPKAPAGDGSEDSPPTSTSDPTSSTD